ncbi:MAG: hypothetical protein GXP27_00095 [Planctomycetes bacterium]|nr:hypothetical protein [Planctomycetota bacterium]
MKISLRGWIVIGLFGTVLAALLFYLRPELTAAEKPATPEYRLKRAWLGQLLRTAGLTPQPVDNRYDFSFQSTYDGAAWNLTMTAVLSGDGEWVWLMAWLDELPRDPSEVPRTALLRLLALNDQMGAGKFFAFIPSSRRFVLQKVISSRGLDGKGLRAALTDLGATVARTYDQWAVAKWKRLAVSELGQAVGGSWFAPATSRSADVASQVSRQFSENASAVVVPNAALSSTRTRRSGRVRLSSGQAPRGAGATERKLQWTPFPRP